AARTWGVNTIKPGCTNPPSISLQMNNSLSFDFDIAATGPYLNPPYVSAMIHDPTDPAMVNGIVVDVKDSGNPVDSADYSIAKVSSNTGVVSNVDIVIIKAN